MACTIKFKDGTEMPEAEFYAWAMDNIDLKEFAKSGNIIFINKKEEAAKFSAIKKLAYNLQKGFQALFGNKVEIITDTEEIDRVLAGDRKNIKMQIDGKEVTVKPRVSELFEANPELANAVYEALGIVVPKDIKVKGKVFYAGKEFPNTFQITFETNDGKYIGFAKVSNKNIDSIELQPEFRKKGLGTQIYVLLGEELANKGITLESANYTGTGPLSSQAKSLWESLVRKGYAVKTENNYKFVSKAQQKQQALQLYSQYLDTIFPDSKVKDIVYHGTHKEFDIFKQGVSYFTEDINYLSSYGKKKRVILNIKNPKKSKTNIAGSNLKEIELKKEGFDGVYITKQDLFNDINRNTTARSTNNPNIDIDITPDGKYVKIDIEKLTFSPASKEEYEKANIKNRIQKNPDLKTEIVVFEPEQIHILGSKQDIEGFKKFTKQQPVNEPTVAEGQPMFMRDPKGKVLGFVYEGKIYIDPRTASPTTPIHEFGHIWNQYMKENHKAFYNRGIKLIKEEGGVYIEKVKKLYPELAEKGKEADLYEEALAQAIGDKGRYIGRKNQNKFLSWLKDMWKLTKEGLKLSVSAETLSNMTLNEYTDLVAGSMLKGAEIATLLRAERTSQASTNPKFIKSAVKKLIATKDKVTISLSRLMGQLYKAESKGYANAITTIKARIAASKAYQKKIIEYLNDRGIPITDKMKLEIAKVKDELSYANTMMKLIDMDNASIRLEQIGRIKKLIKAVKKLRKSKNLTSTDKSFINELELPSVYEISDLDGYEELLGKLKRSLTGNVVLGIKNQLDEFITNEAEYINAYKESIAEIKKMIQTREWEEEYEYLSENNLLGGTNIKSKEDWISFKERLIDFELEEAERNAQEAKLNKIEENIRKKAELLESIKTSIKDLMHENKSELEEAFGEFNETSTPISYSDIFKNIDNLSYNQLVKLGNVLNNILSDEDFNGIGTFASLGRLNSSFQDVRREATKAISDKENKLTPLSERIAKSQTVSQIISEVTRGGASIEKLKNFIMGNWETMISKVQSQYNKSFKEFKELSNSLFGKKAFEHWTRIDTYAFINQWVKYDEAEEINRTIANRVKNRAKQHIDFLKSINPYDKNPNTALEKKQAIAGLKALQDFGVIKNLDLASLTYELEDDITPETLAGKLDEKEQRMYDFMLNKFKGLSNYRGAMSINFDIDYDDIQNYFPTFPEGSYQTEDAKIEDLERSFVRFGRDNGRAKGRTKNLAKSYKIGLIENFSKGYWDALIIDMGSNELLDMSNMLNNSKSGLDRLKEYGLDGDSIEVLKEAIKEKVLSEKNGGTVYGKAENALRMEAGRLLSNIAAGLLLKGSNQMFKQAIPAMFVNFSLKPEAATLATRMLANSNFNRAVFNLIDSSTIKYRLNVYEINPSDLGFPVEYFDALVGDAFSKLKGKGFSAIKAVESLQKIVSDPLYSLTKLVSKSNYDSFLEASDAYISKINILTAYIEHQKAAGKSFEDIVQELKSNKVNQSALKYAEKWQADLNSESKRVNMSKKLKEHAILYYMRGFSLTTHQSFAQAVRKLGDKKLRSDMDEAEIESWKTTRNAFIMQQVMFRLVSMAVANWTISSLIQSITKSKPDDDDEEVVKVGIELAAAMVSDILLGSASVIGTTVWAGVVNAIWAIASNKMVEQREEESIADSNKKKLQRPIANAGQVGGAEVALINLLAMMYFDWSMPSSEVAYAKVGGFLISASAGSKEIFDATKKFSNTLEREAKVSTLIDEELNTDLANYSYQISEEDKKTLVKELRNAPYNEIKTRVFFSKSSRELCVIPKDSYKKLMKDAAFELFGTRSEYLDVIRGTQAFKNLSSMKMQKFISNAPLYANEIAYIRANTKGDIINNEEIKQLIRSRARDIIERNIKGGTNPYGLSKYKVENIR